MSATQADVERLTKIAADCYRLSGADPDGNEDWRLARDAVQAVANLRTYSDAAEARADALARQVQAQADTIAAACKLLDTSNGLHIPDELPLVEKVADRLRFQAEQIARLEGERDRQYDQAVEATGRALRAEQRLARLEGALRAWKAAREALWHAPARGALAAMDKVLESEAALRALAATPEAT